MSEISPNADATPPARRRALRWWGPGCAVGLVTAAVTFAAALWESPGAEGHKARALVQSRAEARQEEPPQPLIAKWRRFLARDSDFLTRVIADPAVAQLATIKAWADPVAELEQRLVVAESTPTLLEMSLIGDAPEDLRVILDRLVKLFVSDANALDDKARNERLVSLEKVRADVQLEIDFQERAIEMQSRDRGVIGAEAGPLTFLQKRLLDTETLLLTANRELDRLGAERKALRNQQEEREKNPKAPPADAAPDEVRRQARLAELDTQIALKQEQRESLHCERDAVRKAINNAAGGNIEAMRKALEPRREVLAKLQAQIIQQRFVGDRESASPRGEVTVAPIGRLGRLPRACLFALAGFAAGFALATGVRLTGPVCRFMQRRA